MNQLDQLKRFTAVAVSGAEFLGLPDMAARDVLTDAAGVLQALGQPAYAPLLRRGGGADERRSRSRSLDELLVRVGVDCLRAVPGRVGTAVDARLAFDAAATIARAKRLVEQYEKAGVGRDRVLLGIVATWEGIQAAKALEHQGIRCNLTLVTSFCQAVACGEAGVTMVSPSVGPVAAWHRAAGAEGDDAGVRLASRIYTYFRKFDVGAEVMAAELHDAAQAAALVGCDAVALTPALAAALQAADAPLERRLDPDGAKAAPIHALTLNEVSFRYAVNDDAAACELLAAGIRSRAADAARLAQLTENAT